MERHTNSARKTDTAVIPLGSVEQHSSHLPIGTDCFQAEALARNVAEALDAFLLPVLPVSTCYEHKCEGKFGGVWMSPKTFYIMLQDIIHSLKSQGFKRVILIIGHGGIFISAPAIRELNALYDDLLVINITPPVSDKIRSVLENKGLEIHAGETETSMMLNIREDLVKKDLMLENDFTPDCPREFLNYVSLQEISPTGVWGKSSLGTKEKGELILKYRTEAALEHIELATKLGKKKAW
ncbi:MAG: creatininase family protein [Clostridia bacterium]|nr:creatininase family protein [Clostridia bacterium]